MIFLVSATQTTPHGFFGQSQSGDILSIVFFLFVCCGFLLGLFFGVCVCVFLTILFSGKKKNVYSGADGNEC